MGYDAYRLIGRLSAARTGPMEDLPGATGTPVTFVTHPVRYDGRVHIRVGPRRATASEAEEPDPIEGGTDSSPDTPAEVDSDPEAETLPAVSATGSLGTGAG